MAPWPLSRSLVCFNPRPREGATEDKAILLPLDAVSIHAPVKGRRPNEETVLLKLVSIHAPVKGRQGRQPPPLVFHVVSIHAPVKGRQKGEGKMARGHVVSIHAPVKGRQ